MATSLLDAMLAEAAGDLTAVTAFSARAQSEDASRREGLSGGVGQYRNHEASVGPAFGALCDSSAERLADCADSRAGIRGVGGDRAAGPTCTSTAHFESSGETLERTLTPFFEGERRGDVQWERCALLAKEAGEAIAGELISTTGVRSVLLTHMSDGTPCGTRIPVDFCGSDKKQVIIDRASKWHVTRLGLKWKLCKQWNEVQLPTSTILLPSKSLLATAAAVSRAGGGQDAAVGIGVAMADDRIPSQKMADVVFRDLKNVLQHAPRFPPLVVVNTSSDRGSDMMLLHHAAGLSVAEGDSSDFRRPGCSTHVVHLSSHCVEHDAGTAIEEGATLYLLRLGVDPDKWEKKVFVGAKLIGKHQLAVQVRNVENLPARVKIPTGPSRSTLIKPRGQQGSAMTKQTLALRLFLVGTPYDVARAEASGTQKDKSVAALLQKLSIAGPSGGDTAPALAFALSDEELQDGAEVAKARVIGILQSATRGIRPPSFSRWIRCAADMARIVVAWVLGLLDKDAQLHFVGKEWAGIRVDVTMMIVCLLVRPVEHFQATAAKKVTELSEGEAQTHSRFYEEVDRVFILLKVDNLHLLMGLVCRTTRAEAEQHSEAARHALHVIAGAFYGRVIRSVFRKHFSFLEEYGNIEDNLQREQFVRTFSAKKLEYESGNPASVALVHMQRICKKYLGEDVASPTTAALPFASATEFLDELCEVASHVEQNTIPVEREHATLQRSQDSRAPRGIAAIDSENVARKLGSQIAARQAELQMLDDFERADWRFEYFRRKTAADFARADLMTACGEQPGHSIGEAGRLAKKEELGAEAWATYVEAASTYNEEVQREFEQQQQKLEAEYWKNVDTNRLRRAVLKRELEFYTEVKKRVEAYWDKYKHRDRLREERKRLAVPEVAQFALGSISVWRKEASALVKSVIDLIDLTSLHKPAAKKIADEFPDEPQPAAAGGVGAAVSGLANNGVAAAAEGVAALGAAAQDGAGVLDADEWEQVDMGDGTHLAVYFTYPDLTSEVLLVVWVLRRPMKFVALRLAKAQARQRAAAPQKYVPAKGDPKSRYFSTDFDFTQRHADGVYALKSAKSSDDGSWTLVSDINAERKAAKDLKQNKVEAEVARSAPPSLDGLHPLDRQLLEIQNPGLFAAAVAYDSGKRKAAEVAEEGVGNSCGLKLVAHVSQEIKLREFGARGGKGNPSGSGFGVGRGAAGKSAPSSIGAQKLIGTSGHSASCGSSLVPALGPPSKKQKQSSASPRGKRNANAVFHYRGGAGDGEGDPAAAHAGKSAGVGVASDAGASGGQEGSLQVGGCAKIGAKGGSNYFCVTELQAKEITRRRRKITEQVENWADAYLPSGKWRIADGTSTHTAAAHLSLSLTCSAQGSTKKQYAKVAGLEIFQSYNSVTGGVRRLGYNKCDVNDMQWATCLLLAWGHLQQWILERAGKILVDIGHRADAAAQQAIANEYEAMVNDVTAKVAEIRGGLDDEQKTELAAYCSMPAEEFAYLVPLAAAGLVLVVA
eukprot:g750.t1